MSDDPPRPRPLARHDGTPAFAEPWQAEALAIAELLFERGMIEAGAWASALGAALRHEPAADDPREHYYRAVLRALERLLAEDGHIAPVLLGERIEAWRQAYLHTPHGRPVELGRGIPHKA